MLPPVSARRPSLVLLATVACGGAATPDARVYAEAVALARTDVEAAMARCAAVGGSAAGECGALTAAEVARRDPERAIALCATVTDDVWRDECGFLVAENSVTGGNGVEAAPRCASAGRFADNCLMHLWKQAAEQALEAGDLGVAAGEYGGSLAWADGTLVVDDALRSRFWDVFFDAAIEGQRVSLDLGRCATLDGELRTRCTHALPASLQRALNRADRRPDGVPGALDAHALCSGQDRTPAERVEAAIGIRYVPAPVLDGVASRFIERRCAAQPKETP